ncbi:chromosome-associated kinesin KIF4A-like [Diadema antillarum]|uniref:chromosome-associated kinesin KIF4A-like n=1 Tax=Diadema antillarum TaxID=105358 RepID=UPI003A8BFA1F
MPEEQGKDISVRVALRSRPLIPKEVSEGCQPCLSFTPGEPQVVLGKDKAFTYDYVFKPEDPQEMVYKRVVDNLVDGLFKGYNATVLAYGQTGSGKTYAMGNAYNMTDEVNMGVIPRVIRRIFRDIEEKKDVEIILKVSYLEIYKEDINDLLMPQKKESLAIREDIAGGIRVAGLSEVVVESAADMFRCLEKGSVGRTTGSTAMNLQSSRSHAIFTIYVDLQQKDSSESCCHAKFHLVDLAGSERAKRTQAQGERLKEGININRGLLALGNVISALGDENGRKAHVPYRDSKLTRLLQDSLGGNSQTVMIACVSPADSNLEETLNTLRYADRARRIKNKPIVNRDPQTAELARLKQQVQQLQIQLLQGKILNGEGVPGGLSLEGSADLRTLLDRNKKLEEENGKLSQELQASVDQTTQLCEKLILAEMSKDKLRQKLEELRARADMSIGALDMTVTEEGQPDTAKVQQQLGFMKDLQKKIQELQAENQREDDNAETLYGDPGSRPTTATSPTNGDSSPEGQPKSEGEGTTTPDVTKTHTLRQAALSRELHELNQALAMKQELAQKMGQSDEKMAVMRIQYETTMKQLEDQVNTLLRERDTLSHELTATKANSASNKLSEQRRKRLQELEAQIGELKKKITAQSKLIKLKERSDLTINKLNTDITSMKQARVRLMKQMKEETSKFQQWKQAKDKEVLQLKAKDRKRQFEFVRMERQHEKTQNVLRRKMEEASAANKRLREALEKKKTARNQKDGGNQLEGMGKRVKSWIDHELEVMVSVNEAKRHLGSLLNDRKLLSKDIRELESGDMTQPACKKLKGKSVTARLTELNSEIELRNAQISDLQQKIMDADHDEKSQANKWQHITSMLEAKCGIKWLMESAVMARVEVGQLQSKVTELQSSIDDARGDKEEMEQEMSELKMAHEQERTQIQRAHEDKILYLLTQLSAASEKAKDSSTHRQEKDDESALQQRLHFQEEQIEELKTIHDQLQDTLLENSELKKQLTVASYQGKKSALMPVLTSPEASPLPPPKPKKKSTAAKKGKQQRYTIEEWFSENELTDSETEYEPNDSDSDWHETPHVKRTRRVVAQARRSSKNSSNQSCGCKSSCRSRVCGCVKNGRGCGEDCRCDASKCENRKDGGPDENSQPTEANSSSTTINISDMMNTTIVLDSSRTDTESPDSRDFVAPPPKSRKILAPINGPTKNAHPLPAKLKRENAQASSRKRPSDSLRSEGIGGLITEGELGMKRKRKLHPTNGSFFKPLA